VLAVDGSGAVGYCLAFPSLTPEVSLHSHITGVDPSANGRHIGYALKLHQRAWALDRGLGLITWTHDPLVLRNAWFNAGKLGALPVEYLVDFYGEMTDGLNAGQGSDRLVAARHLASDRTMRALEGIRPVPLLAGAALDDAGGRPRRRDPGPVSRLRVAVPADVEELRRTDPDLARQWRTAVRAELGGRMMAGWTVSAVDRSGWYVLDRPTGGSSS
jgi:predicted GNAT superfamily acetyltransferase